MKRRFARSMCALSLSLAALLAGAGGARADDSGAGETPPPGGCEGATGPTEFEEAPRGPTVARQMIAGLIPTVYLSFGWRPRWYLKTERAGLVHRRKSRRRWEVGVLWNPTRLLRSSGAAGVIGDPSGRRSARTAVGEVCPEFSTHNPDDSLVSSARDSMKDGDFERRLERNLRRRYRRALRDLRLSD